MGLFRVLFQILTQQLRVPLILLFPGDPGAADLILVLFHPAIYQKG